MSFFKYFTDQPIHNASLFYKDYYPVIKKAIRTKWQGEWTLVINKKPRSIRASVSPWQSSAQDQVSRERLLTRLRIGHAFLTHGYLMEQRPPPFCDDCIVPLTVRHILAECPTCNDMRRAHFPNIDGDYDEAMRVILAEGEQCNFDATNPPGSSGWIISRRLCR